MQSLPRRDYRVSQPRLFHVPALPEVVHSRRTGAAIAGDQQRGIAPTEALARLSVGDDALDQVADEERG